MFNVLKQMIACSDVFFCLCVFVFQAASRRSRQVFEAEPVEGVWSLWGEWSECSQTCGVGVSLRSRLCLAPPPPQTRPFSPLNWAGYLPGGNGRAATSPVSPYYQSRHPGPSSIRPGQFGYGKVPFSLSLHRTKRQARHTVNGTDETLGLNMENIVAEEEQMGGDEKVMNTGRAEEEKGELEISEALDTKEEPETTTDRPRPHVDPRSHSHTDSGRSRVASRVPVSRSQSPFSHRPHFDWSSVTAPPPPVHSFSRSRSSPFASPLHRPSQVHRDRELHQGFTPQAPPAGNVYPFQHSHASHPGVESSRHGASQVYKCSGPEKEYRRCFSQVCGGGALDSRAEQCAAFNTQEFMGRFYNWEPFTEVGEDKQCELTCRPAGYRFYVRQAERVRDGTPCFNVSTNDVCIEGRCLTEGCDGVLGSSTVIDKCGVCGGQDSSCRKVTGSFQNATVTLGYHKILDIPAGARLINITERRSSPNYLALRSGTGASVVNGRWAVDPPGDYKAGGTTFTYIRPREQSEGKEGRGESLRAPGPTTTQLQLYVSLAAKEGLPFNPMSKHNPGHGQLMWRNIAARTRQRGSAPNRNARIPPRTDLPPDTQLPFVWRRGGLTQCSASCGKGFQHRVIICVNRQTDEEVSERKCDSAAKPVPEEEPCNTHSCPPFWEVSAWSECSVSCGPGMQQRQLQCRQSFGNRSTMVHPQRCANLTPPPSTQACHLQLCSHWEVDSDWSTCSVDCGVGKRTRSVRCVSDQGGVVNDNECNSRVRPQGSEECNMGPCVTNWYFTDWSNTCSAQCGPGVQKREVVCLTRGGVREGEGGGDCVSEKPSELKACNSGPCVPTLTWFSSPWTKCNVPCGDGTQRRDIICVKKMGNDFTVVPATECAHLEKPVAVQECQMGECQSSWFTTEWSACSRSCGRGLQVREVRCLTPDKSHSQACDASSKPEQEQACNTIPCGPQVTDKNCRDRRDNCMMVVQARMCVYPYYKTACCASCTQSLRMPDDP
uniref:PLAC domain-containing protein n=1 Tax=Oryzias sinensis TaxID=183150 RepID=A0A8C7Z2Y3_9TELE